ncbi:hypothetical protein NE237_011780 [Protea cynaroides]|uniref:Uncharacterized protein n=1 Tax=Protea cynaroides TaxID=273540 RepID=A0A9Q0GVL6_9MAGN|nr:hypothetical protein NE237_011780 [Protea cynaroides]
MGRDLSSLLFGAVLEGKPSHFLLRSFHLQTWLPLVTFLFPESPFRIFRGLSALSVSGGPPLLGSPSFVIILNQNLVYELAGVVLASGSSCVFNARTFAQVKPSPRTEPWHSFMLRPFEKFERFRPSF